ncbi:MAG: hypothetical protein KGH64_01150 [Candidatus Micrarchaeota archaeon]|nr:hypothetical protein [Candidatus Micrarchaeota archaeon]MDE1833924.1 hypothetical protein [Candidatus Micrarchaeota archaeon]MDE1859800.1 hypothetical protein [Candidatus Micrarchaeota archaeon]
MAVLDAPAIAGVLADLKRDSDLADTEREVAEQLGRVGNFQFHGNVKPTHVASSIVDEVYQIVDGHIEATGKLYRGYNFSTHEARDAFLRAVQQEGLRPHGVFGKNAMSLSALSKVASVFAGSNFLRGYGVVFEIDAGMINYRRVRYGPEEPLHYVFEAEVRSEHVPPEAIRGTYLRDGSGPDFSIHGLGSLGETKGTLLETIFGEITVSPDIGTMKQAYKESIYEKSDLNPLKSYLTEHFKLLNEQIDGNKYYAVSRNKMLDKETTLGSNFSYLDKGISNNTNPIQANNSILSKKSFEEDIIKINKEKMHKKMKF